MWRKEKEKKKEGDVSERDIRGQRGEDSQRRELERQSSCGGHTKRGVEGKIEEDRKRERDRNITSCVGQT